jgi:hypothetical protein
MDMGTAIGPEGSTDLLEELRRRVELAKSRLNDLFNEQKSYFYRTSEAIIDAFDLPSEKSSLLLDYAEKLVDCLYRAYPQAESKLRKLWIALNNSGVKVEMSSKGKKTLHVLLKGENWYVRAHRPKKTWIFKLPIYRVNTDAFFPGILNVSDLFFLQAGWRASDELDFDRKPGMATTQLWQIFAWAAVRHGHQRIYLSALGLNKTKPTITWKIKAKDWIQQWPGKGKRDAMNFVSQSPLALLTWYLGDGEKSKDSLRFSIGNDEVTFRKDMTLEIVQSAYEVGYGQLLDVLESEKWILLKQLEPKTQPIYVTLQGRPFLLVYKKRRKRFLARTLFKLEEEELARSLINEIGIGGYMYKSQERIVVELPMEATLFLAENSPEWRKALKDLAQKYSIQPETPSLRRLLELAENPAPPWQRKIYYQTI